MQCRHKTDIWHKCNKKYLCFMWPFISSKLKKLFRKKPNLLLTKFQRIKALIKQCVTTLSQPLLLLLNALQHPKILLQIILDFSYEKLFNNMRGLLWKFSLLSLVKKTITWIITSNIQLFSFLQQNRNDRYFALIYCHSQIFKHLFRKLCINNQWRRN